MIWEFDVLLLTIVLICAALSLFITDLMAASIVFGAYSFLMCLVWTAMGAVDVAFTEAAVGAGVSTVFFIATIYNIPRSNKPKKNGFILKLFASVVVICAGFALCSTLTDLPDWGDPYSPANAYVSKYYLEHSISDTHVPNVVTSVLADYRSYDTMLETCVVFVACMAIITLLRRRKTPKETAEAKALAAQRTPPYYPANSLIVRIASQIMVPFMQLFALYVVAHGHYSPGGGFQGGVILGASLILLAMSYDIKKILLQLKEKWIYVLSAFGVMIFAGVGVICLILGGNFLDYSVLSAILPATDSIMARSHAMLIVEIGVALTVMCSMFGIYVALASDGRFDKGL